MSLTRGLSLVLLACAATACPAQEDPPADAPCPCRYFWQRDLQTIRWLTPDYQPAIGDGLLQCQVADDTFVRLDGLARGFYLNDQRLQWSGVEDTFGAEGILRPAIYFTKEGWTVSAEGEFFLNQRFGPTVLSDPYRDPYRANFDVDVFQVFQLYAQASYGDFYARIGKSRTPFGVYSSPMFTNRLIDAPFIRSDVILWTETGLFLHYEPGMFSFDFALTNGESDMDTNSSKAFLARVGLKGDNWGVGISGKWQDGIGSEDQKRYNNYVGVDGHLCVFENWVVYGEAIYDQHGMHRSANRDKSNLPGALGPRSFYLRDSFKGHKSPISGWGGYIAGGYRGEKVLVDLSYGSYWPEAIGVLGHDDAIHRGVLKLAYNFTPYFQTYAVGLVENSRDTVYPLSKGRPIAYLGGMQFQF